MPAPLYRNVHLADGGILNVAALDLQPQQVLSTALPANPQVGMLVYATDTFQLLQYQSATTGWTPLWNMPWGVVAAPVSTFTVGTLSAGATETRDAVFGNYVFTAVANRNYELHFVNVGLASSVAGDNDTLTIRDGGGSTPSSGSTLIGEARVTVAQTATIVSANILAQFTATAGIHTLSSFSRRVAGTGNAQPNSLGNGRSMFVVDIGPSANPA